MANGPKRRKIGLLRIILDSAFIWGIPSTTLPKWGHKGGGHLSGEEIP